MIAWVGGCVTAALSLLAGLGIVALESAFGAGGYVGPLLIIIGGLLSAALTATRSRVFRDKWPS